MKILVIDIGSLHVDNARQMALEGNEVWYWCSWATAFPKFENGAAGSGIPEITKILDYAPYLDEADLIVFPDCGMGELASHLRSKGYNVFGAGKGEVLELDRGKSIEIMKSLGIDCPETTIVHGIKEAMDFFRSAFKVQETNQSATGKYFVKLNVWRGSQDSFPVENIQLAEYMLKGLRNNFGPHADSLELIIQKTVEGIECGFDAMFNGKEFLKPTMIGFEKGNSYVGCMTNDFSIFKSDMDKFAKYLSSVDYRGFFSTECFYDGSRCSFIDLTARFPMPLGMLYPTFAENYTELLYEIANGSAKSSHFTAGTFLGGIEIASDNAKTEWLPLTVGKNTRLMRYMMEGNQCFSVPGGEATIAMACAKGSSMEDVQKQAQKEAEESTKGIFFSSATLDFVDQIRESYIEPLKDIGFDFDALSGNLKPVTKPKEIKHSEIASESIQRRKQVEVLPDLPDPMDEIQDMMEAISPSRQRNQSTSIFAVPVDKYGIPL